MQNWLIYLDIKVADNLIEDGLDLSDPCALDTIKEEIERRIFSYAYPHEFKIMIKVINAPSAKIIRKLQNG